MFLYILFYPILSISWVDLQPHPQNTNLLSKGQSLDSSSSCHLPKTKFVQTYTKSHTTCPKQRAIRLLTHVFSLYRHSRSLHVDNNFEKSQRLPKNNSTPALWAERGESVQGPVWAAYTKGCSEMWAPGGSGGGNLAPRDLQVCPPRGRGTTIR